MPDVANTLPVSIIDIGLSLLVGLFLGLVLRYHFMRFGSSLVNRRDIGDILPFIVLIIILVISIVKSSLALSLGLVGALSIVRFRTPIKEPEELASLFIYGDCHRLRVGGWAGSCDYCCYSNNTAIYGNIFEIL